MNSKYAWIDYAKAMGIVLVVYGHVARGLVNAKMPVNVDFFSLVDNIIYSFHMPLFFFLSGVLFLDSLGRRGGVGLVLSKCDSVIYPYLV